MAKLRLVPKSTPLIVEHNRRAEDKGCAWCAILFMFLVAGLMWWPIFKLVGAL